MSRWRALIALAVAVTLAPSCRPRRDQEGPFLEAEWREKGTTRLRGEATAEWCDSLRLLQIQALHGDTGVALAIYPVGRLEGGRFRVLAPATADSNRPAAAVALRWFAETSIRGFQGDSGTITMEQPQSGVLTGTFDARAHSVTDAGHATVRGTFRGLVVRPATRGCVARRQHPDSSPGVH